MTPALIGSPASGGYIEGTKTWTAKLANVSFYKNVKKGLPPGSGIFIVCDATNGAPKVCWCCVHGQSLPVVGCAVKLLFMDRSIL
jgi:hypothetical protein